MRIPESINGMLNGSCDQPAQPEFVRKPEKGRIERKDGGGQENGRIATGIASPQSLMKAEISRKRLR